MAVRGQAIKNASNWKHVYFQNTPKKHNLEKKDLEQMMLDPEWHKAVFYREPLERFISGYQSKCEPDHDIDRFHCESAFGKMDPTIREAITQLAWKDRRTPVRTQEADVHFAQQSRFCGGLDGTLQHYDTVERLEKATAREKVSKMLKAVDINPATIPEFDALFPRDVSAVANAADGNKDHAGRHFNGGSAHITNSEKKLRKYFKTPEEVTTLFEHYMGDYLLFGIKAPTWAARLIPDRPTHIDSLFLPRPWRTLLGESRNP